MLSLSSQVQQCLETNILPYWINKVQDPAGGFYGRVDGHDLVHPDAARGAVLNARILWAFAAAYRVLRKAEYLAAAEHAYDYVTRHFIDPDYGGVYWSVDSRGQILDAKKQTYAIGFMIYGLSEYARATGSKESLAQAAQLFRDLETHAFDKKHNGYIEALTRTWEPIADMRLSDKDENGSRTMNTHLHILEPYTILLRAARELGEDKLAEEVAPRVRNLIGIFVGPLLNFNTAHLDLFFDDEWKGKRNIESFGHDIEASWLLHEALLVLGDKTLTRKLEPTVRNVAHAADEGLQPDGSMIYEHWKDTGRYDRQRQWWVECECVIGHVNLYQHFGDKDALRIAERCWQYIDDHLVDHEHGEWHWAVRPDGSLNLDDDKAGFWKCPYHNTRMCLELIERLGGGVIE